MEPIIKIQDLHYAYPDRVIFSGVNINVQPKKITAIMGPSGTGKTTLLRLIGGQILPDQGTILLEGENIPTLKRQDLYRVRRRMGMLFQSGALFNNLTVFENVAFPLREHTQLPESFIRDLVLMKLEAVGLRGASQLMPNELSGGMSRRVALARAVILDPEIIMYDEPFSGQDPIATGALVKLVSLLNTTLGLTSIIVSHDVSVVREIADYVYMVAGGKVIGEGTPAELDCNPSPLVQQFLKGLADGPVTFHTPAKDYRTELFSERAE